MKILFVYDGEYPWDIRVEKLCNSFLKHQHEVHMVCRNKARKLKNEIYNQINIHRISSLPAFFGKLNEAVTFPAFFSPFWLVEIYVQARNNKCELIIVRDLPMALAAVWVGKILQIPVVLDMAECYPEMLKCIREFEGFKFKNTFLRNPLLAYIVENRVMKKIDAVMVMVEESRARLLKKGVNINKIFIVSNTPEVEKFKEISCGYTAENGIKLLYVGLISRSRGIDVCISAVKKYIEITGNKIIFNIAGTGGDSTRLHKIASDLGIEDKVNFLGWIENENVPELISKNNVCVVPHRRCTHWDNTIPNKLFDYMAAARPVLVSDVLPMRRIVSETKSGLIFRDADIDDFVAKLICLSDPKARDEFGNNGASAVVHKYNWHNEETEIVKILDKLKDPSFIHV